jgi:hypothetical protein
MSQILKFPDNASRRSRVRGLDAVPRTEAGTVTGMPSGHLHVMTGSQWDRFIQLMTRDEQQAFMADMFKLITEHLRRIGDD